MFGLTSFKCSRTLDSETTWGGINESEGRKTFCGLSDIPVKLQHTTLQQPFPVSVWLFPTFTKKHHCAPYLKSILEKILPCTYTGCIHKIQISFPKGSQTIFDHQTLFTSKKMVENGAERDPLLVESFS